MLISERYPTSEHLVPIKIPYKKVFAEESASYFNDESEVKETSKLFGPKRFNCEAAKKLRTNLSLLSTKEYL